MEWMLKVRIPNVRKAGLFVESKMLQLPYPVGEEETQLILFSIIAKTWKPRSAAGREALTLHADHASRYKDKFLAFGTVMKAI
ncbi:MAG: hypothetical protein EPO28_11790 [Saprospiraceae bacterium]|nr:MAG: hypothetical protein EPO28_11790 [Saprospiraceae bacterium]